LHAFNTVYDGDQHYPKTDNERDNRGLMCSRRFLLFLKELLGTLCAFGARAFFQLTEELHFCLRLLRATGAAQCLRQQEVRLGLSGIGLFRELEFRNGFGVSVQPEQSAAAVHTRLRQMRAGCQRLVDSGKGFGGILALFQHNVGDFPVRVAV
jgi:hypothetical protein